MSEKKVIKCTIDLSNVHALNDEARARLAAIREEDIDTTDIPPLRDDGKWYRPISPAERARRLEAVKHARASMRLSGFKLSEADELHAQRFINGQIDLAEYVKVRPTPKSDDAGK